MRSPRLAIILLSSIALAVALPARAIDSHRRSIAKFVSAFKADDSDWTASSPDVDTILVESCRDHPRSYDADGALASKLGIPRELSATVIDAIIWSNNQGDYESMDLDLAQKGAAASWLSVLEDASRKAANPAPIVRSTISFHARWDHVLDENHASTLRWLRTLKEPAIAAIELADSGPYELQHSIGLEALGIGLSVHPDHPALLFMMSETADDLARRVAYAEAALRAFDTLRPAVSVDLRTMLSQRVLRTLIDAGLAESALSTFATWSDAQQEDTLRLTHGKLSATIQGLPLDGELEDLHRDLALAAAVAGDPERAARWAPPLAPVGPSDASDPNARTAALQSAMLDRFLHPTGDDPFELFVDVLLAHADISSGSPVPNLTWCRLLATLAEREHYPDVASYIARETLNRSTNDSSRISGSETPEPMVTAIRTIAERIASLDETINARFVKGGGETQAGRVDHVAPSIDRLLAAPPSRPFKEHPLPVSMAPADLADDTTSDRAQSQASKLGITGDFEIVRLERAGAETVALGVSQDLDPVGELSRGAYWVIRSVDGGNTWQAPLYTGLRVTMPYVIPSHSHLPMIVAGGLHVEVAIKELDTTSITFPPVATRTKREAKGLYLDIPWVELERDSDGDGLTDLVEERLVTDPKSRDTDGDGLDDGSDTLPQVPLEVSTDDRTPVLQALVSILGGSPSGAIIHEAGASDTSSLDDLLRNAKRASLTDRRASFFVGDRTMFRGLEPAGRFVVFSPEEHSLLEKKFGPVFATRIPLLVVDRSRKHGLAIWDSSWTGGTIRFEKSGDRWVQASSSFWIT